MKLGQMFPSKYLKAADIPEGRFVPLVIDKVVEEDMMGKNDPDDLRHVAYFQGKQKGMVLNRTNAETIGARYGDESDNWGGAQILLYATEVLFNGKNVPCLRVKIPKQQAAPVQPQRQPATVGAAVRESVASRPEPENPINNEQEFKDDDIPF